MTPRAMQILGLLRALNHEPSHTASLSEMAERSNRSRWDLHRQFLHTTGETPKRYTQRVRLDRAAAQLLSTGRSVAAVAFDNGFASHEVFTRAFTRRFGLSPSAYRKRGSTSTIGPPAPVIHAELVDAVSPCVGLYGLQRSPSRERNPMTIEVEVTDIPGHTALVARRRALRDEIAEALGWGIPLAFDCALRHGLTIVGRPFARYLEVGLGAMTVECGVMVALPPDGDPGDAIEVVSLGPCRAAVAVHRGPYDSLHLTHIDLERWLAENSLAPSDVPWEIYLTDPGEHPDPTTWETQIVQPIEPAAT